MSDINTLMESLSKFNGKWPYQDAAEQLIKQQAEIISLREQVEKLMKEGVEYREKWLSEQSRNLSEEAEFEILSQQVVALEYLSVVDTAAIENLHEQLAAKDADNKWLRSAVTLKAEQLAALAEQNEKQRAFLEFAWKDIPMNEYAFKILEHVMNLPNLAAPALNRIRAEGMRMAAQFIEDKYDFLGEEITVADEIRARADELEQSK